MPTKLHTFAVYVEDRPGVLNRVSSLFRRRGFNIQSLAVGHSELPGISRLTAVVEADEHAARRIRAHLEKLIDVVRVDDITDRPSVVRDLALIKVSATHATRPSLLQLVQVFEGRVVDIATDSVVVEICASEARIDAFVDVLRPYGVIEMVRTGRVAMTRGASALTKVDAAAPDGHAADESLAASV